jgi:membrane protease YdiL (CAAX protease family)
MKQSFVYQPTYFFLSSLLITSVVWLIAAYVSYQQSLHYLVFPLILCGMSSPSISALIMFAKARDKSLWSDFCQRLRFNRIDIRFIPLVLLFMPCLILLAIAISLLFGLSPDQFLLSQFSSDQALEGVNFLALVLIVTLSCSLEEIGWRGYGIDSLNSKFNLWRTSLIFATIWSLWHVPAFFIKNGYFQQEVWNLGIIYVANYFISLFPVTILINWLYIKNNRSILIAILFHAVMNISYGLFKIQPFTKIIFMFLLLVVAGIVVIRDKEMFLKRPE